MECAVIPRLGLRRDPPPLECCVIRSSDRGARHGIMIVYTIGIINIVYGEYFQ